MKKKLQVFISSTYKDLRDERQAAVSAILKAGHIPAGMELFTSGDESQMETIKRWIDESDVFMLILGGRYGSIEPTTSLSYTELEYDYAVNSGKPYFAVVIDDDALDQKVKEMGRDVIESDYTKELAAFRKKVLSRTSAFFGDVRDIRLTVHETISDFTVRYDFKGWISGGEIPDIQPFLEQIKKLNDENKRLGKDNELLQRQLSENDGKKDDSLSYQEILKLLKEIEIRTKLFNKQGEEEKYTLLKLIQAFDTTLISGVYNRVDSSDTQNFLYHNVCPKLQIYDLVVNESVPNVAWRRYALSPKGTGLLAHIEKLKIARNQKRLKSKQPE